jgi:hypothetical protein
MPILILLGKLLDLVNSVTRPVPMRQPVPIRVKGRRQR